MRLSDRYEARFWSRISPEPMNGCWLWLGTINTYGYGAFYVAPKTRGAHRVAFELLRHPIPRGKQIDHLCRVRCCANPSHMEVVDNRTNVLRGLGPTAQNAIKTVCKHGHPLSDGNLLHRADGTRQCRICCLGRYRRYRQKRKEATDAE